MAPRKRLLLPSAVFERVPRNTNVAPTEKSNTTDTAAITDSLPWADGARRGDVGTDQHTVCRRPCSRCCALSDALSHLGGLSGVEAE